MRIFEPTRQARGWNQVPFGSEGTFTTSFVIDAMPPASAERRNEDPAARPTAVKKRRRASWVPVVIEEGAVGSGNLKTTARLAHVAAMIARMIPASFAPDS
jgi:hypothetical protein